MSPTEILFTKLYKKNYLDAITDIISFYEKNHYGLVNFLYFANTSLNNSFENQKNEPEKKYFNALIQGDFLLPDGIALHLRAKAYQRKHNLPRTGLSNLNGTDFIPKFLEFLGKTQKISLILYGASEKTLEKASLELKKQGYNIIHQQNGYEELNLSEINIPKETIGVLLIARGSPRQENRSLDHKNIIKEKRILAFTVGGLLDFIAKSEKRAPKRVRIIHCERLRRFIKNPSKNRRKFMASFSLFSTIIRKIILN
ncbi:MAG TPA: WecB/TagA/CpsF family glycosyltransferase [Candidatus Absconditabacterales bacterium]|nr:WecB/TagA/CpsF family glycosyltransferase [Candidatus Absconditabacterales bacterium]